MDNQAYIFVIFILYGFLAGIIFDIFRVVRKSFKTPNIVTYIQDIVFWIIIGITLLFTIFRFNDGELRSYIFIGIALGLTVYMLVFSKSFILISVKIIEFVKKMFVMIVIKPINLLLNIIKKITIVPIIFIMSKSKSILFKFVKSFNKLFHKFKLFKKKNKST